MDSLIKKARSGSKEASLEIVQRLRPLIYASMKKYPNYREAREDMYQDGVLEILTALKDYRPDRGAHFLGYVKMRLRFLYLNKYEDVIIYSLNEKLKEENGDLEKQDLLVDQEEGFERLIQMEEYLELYRAYEGLSPRQKQVIDLYFIGGHSMVEISSSLGISYRTVVNTKTQALKKIRLSYKI